MSRLIAVILGTRPEVIKLAPVISVLRELVPDRVVVICTGQHVELAAQAFRSFGMRPDYALELMTHDQTPLGFLARLLPALESTLATLAPCGVLVQGDTTTTLGGALAAFHLRIPVGHIEAGLRTHDLRSPFPEEMNRVVVSRVSELHFCPTETAADNLRKEGISSGIHVVGNTVVDAVELMAKRIKAGVVEVLPRAREIASRAEKLLFVTSHRRDNFGEPLLALCRVLKQLSVRYPELEIIWPVHLNPNVLRSLEPNLGDVPNIHLLEPVDYPTSVYLIGQSDLIISDSGGIQEEAPTFGVPVIVARATTERPEGVRFGTSYVRPLEEPEALFATACELLNRGGVKERIPNPFGDGCAAERIVRGVLARWTPD